jgi:hypothetical protein
VFSRREFRNGFSVSGNHFPDFQNDFLVFKNDFPDFQNDFLVFKNDILVFKNDLPDFQNDFPVFQNLFLVLKNDFPGFQNRFLTLQNDSFSFKNDFPERPKRSQASIYQRFGGFRAETRLLRSVLPMALMNSRRGHARSHSRFCPVCRTVHIVVYQSRAFYCNAWSRTRVFFEHCGVRVRRGRDGV